MAQLPRAISMYSSAAANVANLKKVTQNTHGKYSHQPHSIVTARLFTKLWALQSQSDCLPIFTTVPPAAAHGTSKFW